VIPPVTVAVPVTVTPPATVTAPHDFVLLVAAEEDLAW
jgi:hypothetical protein